MSFRLSRLLLLVCLSFVAVAVAQMPPDQQAQMLLSGGQRAFNEKNYPFAAGRFREFLQKYGGHKDAPAARYGLALCLLEGTERDADKALEQLTPLLGQKTFADYPYVLYYAGLARRAQAIKLTDQPQAKERYEAAARHYGEAAAAFAARAKDAKAPAKGLSDELEWALRSRCDQAELLLKLRKAKEAREAVAGFVTEKGWGESRSLPLGLYYHGFASFQLDDLTAAGKALSQTSVLNDDVVGSHARYLLARVHHLNTAQNEREEARQNYQAVIKGYEAAKAAAPQKLQKPANPEEKARLERLARVPEHVYRSMFFLGVLQYEDGRFGEAAEFFKTFAQQQAKHPLAAEARLRLGYCQVQQKQADEAIRTLQGIVDKEPTLADQALYWIARAQATKADAKKPESFKPAIEAYRRAMERTKDKGRRGEILVDLAEAYTQAKQYREAVAAYTTVTQEKLLPMREEEVLLGLATAQQLAGDLGESEKTCAKFLERFKASPLTPAVLFRHAENAALQALKATTREAVAKHHDEAVGRYGQLVEKYPEAQAIQLARQGLGMAHYRKGELDKAQKAFEGIPAADRAGDLAMVAYCLADIYLRQLPARADDAVAAGRMEEKLKQAGDMLDGFVAAMPESPQVPDALVKLGFCKQRMAKLLAQPAEQQKALADARAAYERVQQKYRKEPAYAQATFERAKVLIAQKDVHGSQAELRRFAAEESLKKSPFAPMAAVLLSTSLRTQNRFVEAVDALASARKAHEAALAADPARAGWATVLQYHHAAALREAGKIEEARVLFEQVAKADRPECWDALVRAGQCAKELAEKKLADGRKQLANATQKPAGEKLLTQGLQELRNVAGYFTAKEQELRARKPAGEDDQKALAQARGRLVYEAAWVWRTLADGEIDAVRAKLQADRGEKRKEEVTLDEVPRQPAEAQVRARYQEMIAAFPELPLTVDARLELAEVLAQRREYDDAVKVLQGALEGEREPAPEVTERIKLRLGACLLDRGSRAKNAKDVEAALEQLQPITANAKSPLLAQASYREAECLLQLGKAEEAIKLLTKFRDHQPFQNVAGVSDRALLRLGAALGEKKQWEPARQAYEVLLGRFGGSPWRHEARYGMGWAQQNQGQYDAAVSQYSQVTAAVATRLGARAQLNIGLCRLAQKRWADASAALQVVPYTYDYADLTGLALLEAARALVEDKKKDEAVKLLRKVVKDHAGTEQAEAARKRLKELEG